ncbi:MAG: hypothetical protein ACRDQF_03335, partial [Thermocrispum sp.]
RAWWTVEIEDDGVGDSADVRTRLSQPVGLSFGLSSLADEAARLGGRLWVSRAQRLAGISLSVSVPVGLGC